MRKYEWDKRLRKALKPLSEREADEILDYYDEMFEDKRDRGFGEREILDSFGSPEAVAEKILRESGSARAYGAERFGEPANQRGTSLRGGGPKRPQGRADSLGTEPPPKYRREENLYITPPYAEARAEFEEARFEGAKEKPKKKDGGGRVALFIFLLIVFWVPILALTVTLFAIMFALSFAFVAVAFAGAATMVFGFIDLGAGVGAAAGMVEIGAGVLLAGIGILLCPLGFAFGKFVWKSFRAACGAISRWLKGRTAA